MQCKYIGDGTDPELPYGSRCSHKVMTEADKSQPSKVWRDEVNGDGCRLIVLFPSKVCEHGLCRHHYYKKYWEKYGAKAR